MFVGSSIPIPAAKYLILSWTAFTLLPAASRAELPSKLEAYFAEPDAKKREGMLEEIRSAADGDVNRIVQALSALRLWSDLPNGGEWSFKLPSGDTIEVTFRLPLEYQPRMPIPIIVVMPDAGQSPRQAWEAAMQRIGPPGYGCGWIIPARPVGGTFRQRTASAADLPALLREVRRRIHLDADRVYLFGSGSGGDAAWMAAIAHPDEFAAVIVVSSFPRLPYPEQSYTILLPNLRDLPILSLWHPPGDGPESDGKVAKINRAIVEYARLAAIPIRGGQVPRDLPWPPAVAENIKTALTASRPVSPKSVRMSVRYPQQAATGWLRCADFAGSVWEDDQFSILAPPTDRDRFITETIAERLVHISGAIDGQTITIETRRCARVEIRLSPDHADLSQPIRVICNGRRRFEGIIEPSVTTLLETAWEAWNFQRPVVARRSFAIHAD